MKHKATARAGRIEKFEDVSRELFLSLKRSPPINCQAQRPRQRYPSCDGQAETTGREEITNPDRASVH